MSSDTTTVIENATTPIFVRQDSTTSATERRKRRWRSGTVAEREIRKMSRTTDTVFPDAPFQRLVREIAGKYGLGVRFSGDGMDALHGCAEEFVTDRIIKVRCLSMCMDGSKKILFRKLTASLLSTQANLARTHAKRKTLLVEDIEFAKFMVEVIGFARCLAFADCSQPFIEMRHQNAERVRACGQQHCCQGNSGGL